MNIELIVATDLDNGIGKNGDLPWRLKADMAHLKHITTSTSKPSLQNGIIMGRKTWESLPPKFKPLPDRLNIILSKTLHFTETYKNTAVFTQLTTALTQLSKNSSIETVFIFGGQSVYEEALTALTCSTIHKTVVHNHFNCDMQF